MGLQAKVIFACLVLLSLALGASCWMFGKHARERLSSISAEEARQLSSSLVLALQDELRDREYEILGDMAQELVKSRNVLFVTFFDPDFRAVALASRDPEAYLQKNHEKPDAREIGQVLHKSSPLFGNYVELVAPVLSGTKQGQQPVLCGYIAVGTSQATEEIMLQRANYVVLGIGGVLVIFSMPLAYLMVRRIFHPIHELVRVTRKITSGDLDARVALNRTDVIGELARSFNEMVMWVKSQQQDVAAANKKLAEVNRDLEEKVAARTAQVETALERLGSEIREKEEFLRAVSHDLNAPLRNISGMATMLLMKYRDKLDEDVLHRLERIKKNVDVETDLIGELLDLSRIKTRRQRFEIVDVEAMVWELRGLFENDLKSKAIQLIVDSQLPVLEAERARLRQVFQNLVDNAIKYMGDGLRREIHVGCVLRPTEAEFWVRDTGLGIDAEDVDKVFFVFRRGKNSASANIAGKGIGLASVKSIIETYNGNIWVESAVGEGTTFRFTINGKFVPALGGGGNIEHQTSDEQSEGDNPESAEAETVLG